MASITTRYFRVLKEKGAPDLVKALRAIGSRPHIQRQRTLTGNVHLRLERLWKATQRHFPFVAAFATAIALVVWREALIATVADRDLSLSDLYSAVFNWSAIQTGFLFSVYGFIVAKADGFIAAIKKTKAMARFLGHLGRAMIAGFVLTILSMALVVLSPSPSDVGVEYFALAVWFSLFVWAFVAFLRVAFIFGQMARVPDNKDIPG